MKIYVKLIAMTISCFLFFTACNNGETPAETDTLPSDGIGSDGIDSDGIETEPAVTEPDPTKPAEVKVGFIYSGAIDENSFNAEFENSRYEIMKLSGVTTCYIDNVLVQQFEDAVQALKNDGCGVIVATSNHYAAACASMAQKDSDGTYYVSYGNLTNQQRMSSFIPSIYQPVAVTGLVAAYNTDSNTVGMVVDNNAFHAKGIADAFAQGIRELDNASIDLYLNYALSDSNADTKRAIDNLVAKGADIIFLYQTSIYGIKYCEEIGVKVIGYAYNMPELAPEHYLTGYYAIPKNYVIESVRGAQYNNFKSTVTNQGLKHGYVGMIQLNENICKKDTGFITDKYYNYVYEGKAAVFTGEMRDSSNQIRVDKGAALTVMQILSVDWLTSDIKEAVDFSGPRTEDQLVYSDLTIKY